MTKRNPLQGPPILNKQDHAAESTPTQRERYWTRFRQANRRYARRWTK